MKKEKFFILNKNLKMKFKVEALTMWKLMKKEKLFDFRLKFGDKKTLFLYDFKIKFKLLILKWLILTLNANVEMKKNKDKANNCLKLWKKLLIFLKEM